jgi:hypothetical protein
MQSNNGQNDKTTHGRHRGRPFANAAMQAIRSAHANEETDGYALGQIATELGDIKRQIRSLTEGTCQNHKLLLNAPENHQTTKTVNVTAKSTATTFNNKLLVDLCSAMAVSGRIDAQPQDTYVRPSPIGPMSGIPENFHGLRPILSDHTG